MIMKFPFHSKSDQMWSSTHTISHRYCIKTSNYQKKENMCLLYLTLIADCFDFLNKYDIRMMNHPLNPIADQDLLIYPSLIQVDIKNTNVFAIVMLFQYVHLNHQLLYIYFISNNSLTTYIK